VHIFKQTEQGGSEQVTHAPATQKKLLIKSTATNVLQVWQKPLTQST